MADINNCKGDTYQTTPQITGCGKGGSDGDWSGLTVNCKIKGPELSEVIAPWVQVEFGEPSAGPTGFNSAGSTISVSNRSSPGTTPQHVAVIQSFDFGQGAGFTVSVTIQDQQGGSFVKFLEHLFKEWVCLDRGIPAIAQMKFQFGWVRSDCGAPLPTSTSPCYFALMDSIETSFRDGKFFAEITGKDIPFKMCEGQSEKNIGGDGIQGECLVDAVTRLLTNAESPNIGGAVFRRMENGIPVPAGFEIYHCDIDPIKGPKGSDGKPIALNKGPKGKWSAQTHNKLTAVKRWTDGWRSNRRKGWAMSYNSQVKEGELIFWEDRKPICTAQDDKYWDQNCLGTYIVNGSKDSSVIEFNPSIQWNFSRLLSTGGQTGNLEVSPLRDETGAKSTKAPGRRDCPSTTRSGSPGAGGAVATTTTENHDALGPEGVSKKMDANAASHKSMQVVLPDPINADLVIIGDPTIDPVFSILVKNVTIIFINPFHILGGQKGCGDWLASPTCNEILSNKAWMVKEVHHTINAGRYTTKMKLTLTTPTLEGDTGEPLGLWIDGWKPQAQC